MNLKELLGDAERLVFGSLMTQDVDSRVYQEIPSSKEMKEAIESYLEEYNETHPHAMHLSMFLDACGHICKICRVLEQPNGNCLLLGVGGSGRQSLTRLATHLEEFEMYQIEVIKGYGLVEFRDDLKTCLMRCGVENKVEVFLFCDTQIVNEQFVECVNNILNSGDVPNLYKTEDLDAITTVGRGLCTALGLQPTKANMFTAYLTRVKKNVHCVLAFSPVGDAFRDRIRMFPSLVNNCTIDWFLPWPAEALYSVASQKLEENEVQLPNKEGVLQLFRVLHQSVEACADRFKIEQRRTVYITPTSYLELLSTYIKLLALKRMENKQQVSRYAGGLEKIQNAEGQVGQLQIELEEMRPVLAQTKIEVAEMMEVIEKDKEDAAVVQEACAKEDAQKDLDEALPALDLAVKCLQRLKKEHITEVKNMQNPPAGVKLTMEAVCIMFQIKPVKVAGDQPGKKIDDYWKAAQAEVLTDARKMLDSLMNYDKENIPDNVIAKIEPYINRDDFDPVAIKKASVACEAMCMWVGAMYKYNTVAKAELAEVQKKLDKAQADLRAVTNKIAKLEADLQAELAEVQAKLDKAQAELRA